jgi:adenosine kinase
MSALICGSIAFDTVMVFHGRFRDHILPDRIHLLNVSFLVPSLRRNFGGCAGNIAYNLALLGTPGAPMATVGHDFAPYANWLRVRSVDLAHVRTVEHEYTAQAFITTDLDDNQITAFHPGAMNHSHENHIGKELAAGLAIIGPDGKEGMLQHARECAASGIPFLFDPGQGLPMFSREELLEMVKLASYLAVNDYEGRLLEEKTGRKLEDLARELKALVHTLGADGSVIFADGARHQIPCVAADALLDPTGCGDAYRAGLLYGIARGWDWPSTGRLASVMGSIKIAHRGPQNHKPTREQIAERYGKAFGSSPF